MFEYLKKAIEVYEQEKEAPFNYNGLMTKLSNYRAETYLKISNKLEELFNILENSNLKKIQGIHKIGLPCGDFKYSICFDNGKYCLDNESRLTFNLNLVDKNGGFFLVSTDFPKDLKSSRDKINKLSEESLLLLDNISSDINILFNEIDKGIAEDIKIEINRIREPKNKLLNILKEKYNDNKYEDDYEKEDEYDDDYDLDF